MSTIIRVKGANFANAVRPSLQPYRYGFPKTSMVALHLMEEGTDDQSHTGQFLDSSGNNNHASLKGGWLQPTKRSYGMELGAGGAAIITPYNLGEKFSFVIAVQLNEPIPASMRFPIVACRSASLPPSPTTASASDNLAQDSFLNFRLLTGGATDVGMFNANGMPEGSGTNRVVIGSSLVANRNQAVLLGWSYDSTTGVMIGRNGDAAATVTQVGRLPTDEPMGFGVVNYAASQAIAAGAKLFLAGMWSDSSADLLQSAMNAARTKLLARGVTVLAG